MLYRKGLYLLALNIADTQKLDESHVADIHKQYGDHLYNKGDYDGAMAQYIQTIRHVQPSYVIRKVVRMCHQLGRTLTFVIVPRRPANTQPCDLFAGTSFSWLGQLRSHDAASQHVHEVKGRDASRQLHQARIVTHRYGRREGRASL